MRLVGIISPPYSNAFACRARNEEEYRKRDYLAIEKRNWNWYGANEENIGNMTDELTEDEDLDITKFCQCEELYWYGCYDSVFC